MLDIFDPKHPKSPRAIKIPVRKSQFDSEDPYRLIKAIVDTLNALFDFGLYTRHEIPRRCLQSYYIDYYVTQVINGGHRQFVVNSGWSSLVQEDISQGLAAIGASGTHKLFLEFTDYVNTSEARLEELRADFGVSHPAYKELDFWIKTIDSKFYELNRHTNIHLTHSNWLKSQTWISAVPDLEWKLEVVRIIDANELKNNRLVKLGRGSRDFLSELLANAPLKRTRFEYASELAKKHGIQLPNFPKFRWKEPHEEGELSNNVFETVGGQVLVQFQDLDVAICKVRQNEQGQFERVGPALGRTKMERIEV